MGLGKTVQTVAFLSYLHEVKGVRAPHLIVAPLSTLHGNWRMEFKRWWPDIKVVVYEGAKEVRRSAACTHLADRGRAVAQSAPLSLGM